MGWEAQCLDEIGISGGEVDEWAAGAGFFREGSGRVGGECRGAIDDDVGDSG